MSLAPQIDELASRVQEAAQQGRFLRLKGHGSKDFYGGVLAGDVLDLSGYRGIIDYEPTELFITARCGTPLAEIEAVLGEKGQMLAFEPPYFGNATLGGCVAAGLSGPRRQQAGAVRDFVLGVKLIDGTGQILHFGGQVMKNVAGYDVSRLMAGSMGTLALLADITLKVLPRPVVEESIILELGHQDAIERLNRWGGKPLPISASFWFDGLLTLRFSGARAAVEAAREKIGGEILSQGDSFWRHIREQRHEAFSGPVLWRLALPTTAPAVDLPGHQAIEWGGGQRWLISDADAVTIREAARRAGGHAVLFRAPESVRCRDGGFSSLSPALLALHRRIKAAFDPKGIFSPGRLYVEL